MEGAFVVLYDLLLKIVYTRLNKWKQSLCVVGVCHSQWWKKDPWNSSIVASDENEN